MQFIFIFILKIGPVTDFCYGFFSHHLNVTHFETWSLNSETHLFHTISHCVVHLPPSWLN